LTHKLCTGRGQLGIYIMYVKMGKEGTTAEGEGKHGREGEKGKNGRQQILTSFNKLNFSGKH